MVNAHEAVRPTGIVSNLIGNEAGGTEYQALVVTETTRTT